MTKISEEQEVGIAQVAKETSLKAYNEMKAEINETIETLSGVEIITDTDYAIAVNMGKKANKALKILEDARKTIKQPYLDAGKAVDSAFREISTALKSSLNEHKNKIATFEIEQEDKAGNPEEVVTNSSERVVFETMNVFEVPAEFMMVNETAIRAEMKKHSKEDLLEKQPIRGIRFFTKKSVRL